MDDINWSATLGATDVRGLEDFLQIAGDDDVLRFLRSLPMVAGQDDGQITLVDLIYEMRIWPFVKQAWTEIKGSPGIPGRLFQLSRVYKKAEADFERETGETRRLPRIVDLPAFTDMYATVGLH